MACGMSKNKPLILNKEQGKTFQVSWSFNRDLGDK